MAKVSFSKLGLKSSVKITEINFNDCVIEVKEFLPMEDKLELISKIINCSVDENNYYNPCRIDIFKKIFILEAYTNLNITDKQKENVCKFYDMIYNSGLFNEVCKAINEKDLNWINQAVQETVESIYSYKNSVLGILNTIKENYDNVELDATKIAELINDPNQLTMLKGILDNLG